MHLEAYDKLRDYVVANGFTPALQTRIALFMSTVKGVTLPWLTMASAGPASELAWQAMTAQLFRESEALTTLMRVTDWVPDPAGTMQILRITAPISQAAARINMAAALTPKTAALDALALEHALLATVRFTPIIPAGATAQEPFPVALGRIELENGRLVQAHIRLLKDGFPDMPIEQRESAVETHRQIVDECFSNFLASLTDRFHAAP